MLRSIGRMCDVMTATGALSPRLRELSLATGSLSERSVKLLGGCLAAIADHERRLAALMAAIDYIQANDPAVGLWAACAQLEADLRRFQTAWKRIKSGNRDPRDVYEQSLVVLLEIPGPRCQRRLFEQLTERCQ